MFPATPEHGAAPIYFPGQTFPLNLNQSRHGREFSFFHQVKLHVVKRRFQFGVIKKSKK